MNRRSCDEGVIPTLGVADLSSATPRRRHRPGRKPSRSQPDAGDRYGASDPSRCLEDHGCRPDLPRVVNKLVMEYISARRECRAFVETVEQNRPALTHYFRAIDHVETCVGSLHRTLLHLKAINAARGAPQLDRAMRRALDHATTEINDLRDMIEHADKELQKTPSMDGVSILYLEDEHLRLAEISIRFADLAQWIGQTFRVLRTLFKSSDS